MAENGKPQFDLRQYIQGRVPLPPWVHGKKQKPFAFSGKTINAAGTATAIANAGTGVITINIHDDAYFLVEQIQMMSSLQTSSQDLATVQFTDTTTSQPWSNVAVDMRDAAGTGQNPKYLSDPNILRPSSTFVAQITNNTGSSAEFYLLLVGRKIYGLSDQEATILTRRMWFQYVMAVSSIAASTNNASGALQIFNESDFKLKKLLSQDLINTIMGAAAGSESAEIECQFRNTTSDENLFNQAAAARLIFGMKQGENPITGNAAWVNGSEFCLKKPWDIRRNSQIAGTFNNLSTDATGAFNLTFEGIRIFDAR